jgi:hypothetical protein
MSETSVPLSLLKSLHINFGFTERYLEFSAMNVFFFFFLKLCYFYFHEQLPNNVMTLNASFLKLCSPLRSIVVRQRMICAERVESLRWLYLFVVCSVISLVSRTVV